MSHTNKIIQLSAKAFLLSIGLTLVACGGGGGSSNSIPAAAVNYTGLTDEAVIASDADAIALTQAFITANQENVGGLLTGATTTSTQQPLDSNAKNFLIKQLKQQALDSLNNKNSIATGAGAIEVGNCVGSVGGITNDGSVTETVFTNTNTEGSGKLTYNNLCRYDAVNNFYTIINGDVYYTGKGDLQAGIIDSIVLNLPSLTVYFQDITTGYDFTETISEYISFTFTYNGDGSLNTLTLRIYSDIDVAGTVYRFEAIVVSGSSSSATIKFYHPTLGSITYVDSFIYSCIGDAYMPSGGSFQIITSTPTTYTITPTGACDNTYTVTSI